MSAATDTTLTGGVLPPETVRVWDPFVRLFHWSLVSLFFFAFVTGDEWKSAHILAGYCVGLLIIARTVWGFIGTKHARFESFAYSPATVFSFLKESVLLRAKRYIGHNPAGGAMVIALILSVGTIAATGYMMTTDAYWGIEWVEETHETMVYLTIGLVILHVAGVILASVEHRENLVKSMFTGRKRAE